MIEKGYLKMVSISFIIVGIVISVSIFIHKNELIFFIGLIDMVIGVMIILINEEINY